MCETVIPRNMRLAEAPSHGKPALLYDPHSRGAEAYLRLAKEIIERARLLEWRGKRFASAEASTARLRDARDAADGSMFLSRGIALASIIWMRSSSPSWISLIPWPEIPVGVEYEYKGKRFKDFPPEIESLEQMKVHYRTIPGWQKHTYGAQDLSQLPSRAQDYLNFLADQVGVKVAMVSTGPEREQCVWLDKSVVCP